MSDTPGTNTLDYDLRMATARVVSDADLLLVVFPVENPWAASTWKVVANLSENQLRRSAFILQKSDTKDEVDLEVMVGHIRSLAKQKTGLEPEVFPVSAKLAIEAKKGEELVSHIWQRSGYPALEAFVSRRLSGNFERRRVLQEVYDSTEVMLGRIEEKIQERREKLDRDERFLRELESEVEHRREGQSKFLSERLAGLGAVFLGEGKKAADRLGRKFSVRHEFVSLFKQERLPSQVERALLDGVTKAVGGRADKDGEELVESCRIHWETVEPRIVDQLELRAPDFDRETDSLSGARERFVDRLGGAAREVVSRLRLRSGLELEMELRRSALKGYVAGALCALILAGVCGGLGWGGMAWVFVGVAVLVILLGGFRAMTMRDSLCEEFMQRVEDSRQEFADGVSEDYKEGVREFFVEYGELFEIVRRRIAEQRGALEPQSERWSDLFLELKGIEQEI